MAHALPVPGSLLALLCALLGWSYMHMVTAQRATVLFVNGRTMPATSLPNATVYDATREALITTQILNWYPNGITYWGAQATGGSLTIGGEQGGTVFRVLLRFEDLHRYIPPGAVVESAELTLTVVNWNTWLGVQGCFMTRPWNYQLGPGEDRFSSTGWIYNRWNGSASERWTAGGTSGAAAAAAAAGGWGDCSPAANLSWTVPADGRNGYWTRSVPLPPSLVGGWLANNGSANYGLMFRGMNGTTDLVSSMWRNGTLRRPALALTYNLNASQAVLSMPAPTAARPANCSAVPRTWWVAPGGNDGTGSGHQLLPLRSLAYALTLAEPGDSIYLTTGTYAGSVSIYKPRIRIQSAPGHWAVVASPTADPRAAVNVITIFPGADGGVLSNLEVAGGHYYGVSLMSSWGDYGAADRPARASAPSHWLFQNLRIHDTGSSAIKISMRSVNNTLVGCEIYNAGVRMRTYGYGLDAVQAYDLTVRDCYFHDIPSAAVVLSGGCARTLLERNWVSAAQRGFEVGSYTDPSLMDGRPDGPNPGLAEAINTTLRNNVITAVAQAAVLLRASQGGVVAHNTLWRVQEDGQAAILFDGTPRGAPWGTTPCAASPPHVLWGNLVVKSRFAPSGPLVQVRADGLPAAANLSSALVMGHNVYYDQAGAARPNASFVWGVGTMLEDARRGAPGGAWVGGVAGWAAWCGCDVNSTEAEPGLDATFTPLACSPARSRVPPAMPLGLPNVTTDFHGRARPAAGRRDAGAIQAGAAGAVKPGLPAPVPSAFSGRVPFTGIGPVPVYDKVWPFYLWLPRVPRNLTVDAVNGTDDQPFDYYSNYQRPFKSLQRAVERSNMGDRIWLRAGANQTHAGPLSIRDATNVSIATHPTDLAAGRRATLTCTAPAASSTTPCIYVYGGATALSLAAFDVVMRGGGAGACVFFDTGGGSGSSPYWDFWVAASNRSAVGPKVTVVKNMALTGCGRQGVKLSTYVRDVVLEGLTVASPGGTGVEVYGGGGVTVRGCRVSNPGGAGMRLGGGVRGLLLERNLITNASGPGIVLGSEESAAAAMDTDWPRVGSGSWHDCVSAMVRNNIVDNATGAGIALYSARDVVVVHNSLLRVASHMHAGVLLHVSPKQLGPSTEVGPANSNITFANNIVTLPPGSLLRLAVQARILQGRVVNKQLKVAPPNATAPCNATVWASPTVARHRRRALLEASSGSSNGGGDNGDGDSISGSSAAALQDGWPAAGAPAFMTQALSRPEALMLQQLRWRQRGQREEEAQAAARGAVRHASAAGAGEAAVVGIAAARPLLRGVGAALAAVGPVREAAAAAVSGPAADPQQELADEPDSQQQPAWDPVRYLEQPQTTTLGWHQGDPNAAAASADQHPHQPHRASSQQSRRTTIVRQQRRRQLVGLSFTDPYVYDSREAGRNPDGSCPLYPRSHAWHTDVSGAAVHPRSEAIKSNIGLKNLHLDFGFQAVVAGVKVPAGMPINIVDTSKDPTRLRVEFGPSGYPDESQMDPDRMAPLPANASVQIAFPGCGDPPCGGDRHLIVLDNATCTLYEAWRSFPPSVTGNGTWRVDALARFNLSRNALGRPLGATSADAAGMAMLPGLVRWEEVAVRGEIDHALRFTGPNSRPAYAMPATHFAPAGYTGRDAPYMGMRVRLAASYDCTVLPRAARIVCTALKKYGAFFADNGLPWDFAGEATEKWYPLFPELNNVSLIPSSAMEVLDPGCLCLTPGCSLAECNGAAWQDPAAPRVFAALDNTTRLTAYGNMYFRPSRSPNSTSPSPAEDGPLLFVDQRVAPLGPGFSGGLAGWQEYLGPGGEAGSRADVDPSLAAGSTYRPTASSPARGAVARLPRWATDDFYARSRGSGNTTDCGAAVFV